MKIKLILLAFLTVGILSAQTTTKKEKENFNKRNVITLSIPDLVNKAKIKIESGITDEISIGLQGSYHYNSGIMSNFTGFKLEPLARYYVAAGFNQAPLGMYVQLKASYGQFKTDQSFTPTQLPLLPIAKEFNLTSIGGGVSVGMQWHKFLGKNIVLDINIGGQYLSASVKEVSNLFYYPSITENISKKYRSSGPGSYVTGTIALGIPF